MKNSIILIITLFTSILFSQQLQAQDYSKFEVDLGIKYGILTGDYSGGGVGFFLEPRINANNNLAFGLRLGFDLMGGSLKGDVAEVELSTSLLSSYFLTGNYMFTTEGNIRPFAGLGIGLSSQGSLEVKDFPTEAKIGSAFGILPRVGVELGVFLLAIDYSIYFKDEAKKYIGINIGLNFGGKHQK